MADDWKLPTAISQRTVQSPEALSGQRLGSYVVGERVGSGGMGEVYSGEQPEIGKKVAIKVLKAHGAIDREDVERMLAEARAVNAIRHPNIVDVIDFGRLPDGRPYLVMDWLDGEPLDQRVRRSGGLPAGEAAELLAQLCAPIAAAHAKGIIHRDLKPANIFVSEPSPGLGWQVKLLDFGLARSTDPGRERLTRAGVVVGTPDYLSPEQATGMELGPATDLYSLGVIAYELLTGQLPFSGADAREVMLQKVQRAPPRVSSRVPEVPEELDQLVFELMATAAAARPPSAEEVRRRFQRLSAQLRPKTARSVVLPALTPPVAPAAAAAPPPAPRSGSGRWVLALLVVSAIAAVIAVALVFVPSHGAPAVAPPPATPIVHLQPPAPEPELPRTPEAPAPPKAVKPTPHPALKTEVKKRGAELPHVSTGAAFAGTERVSEQEKAEVISELMGLEELAIRNNPTLERQIRHDFSGLDASMGSVRTRRELMQLRQALSALRSQYETKIPELAPP